MTVRRSLLLAAVLLVAGALAPALADSPITSTPFSEAYLDYAIVADADHAGTMNEDVARYLANEDNPLDVRAAVMNALSWSVDGKENALAFCDLRLHTNGEVPAPDDLRGDLAFVVGYLLCLDNYFEPAQALPYLEHARDELPQSFTVAMVTALVECQAMFDKEDGWGRMWPTIEGVVDDDSLNGDMRVGALKIITDYMVLYAEDAEGGEGGE
jgi:hypothetical protein